MGSGKSLHLMATAHNFQEHAIPFIVIKSRIDDRDGDGVIHSRALGDMDCVNVAQNDDLFDFVTRYLDADRLYGAKGLKWILVDEAQFLTEKQVEELAAVADNYSINIICYGLRTDFKTQLFPGSKRLFELADSIEEIKSSCFCNSKTSVNARLDENKKIITDGEQIEIGGDEKYISLCRKCYFEKTGHRYYKKDNNE